jgi:hypothetical protein
VPRPQSWACEHRERSPCELDTTALRRSPSGTWLKQDEDFLERYARAHEAQADKFFKECIEIADAATQKNCNVARLRVDTRKWAAARLAPKKYGDHMSHDVKGGTNVNFQPQILIQCSSDEEEGFIDVRAAPEAADGLPQQGSGRLVRGR